MADANDDFILRQLIEDYRNGRDARVVAGRWYPLVASQGFPLSEDATQKLKMPTEIINGRKTAWLSDVIAAAKAYVAADLARPNNRAAAAARARAAKTKPAVRRKPGPTPAMLRLEHVVPPAKRR